MSLLKVLIAESTKPMPMSDNALELGVAVVTQGLYDISAQKKRFAFRRAVNRMTIVTDERQAAVMA